MTVETKRHIFVCGENPAMSLYTPGTGQVAAIASFWHITYSPHGTGNALVLWLAENSLPGSPFSPGGVYSDNLPLARLLVDKLTRYFSEFRDVDMASLPCFEAVCRHTYNDPGTYTVTCQAETLRIVVEWADVLDQKLILYPGFPAGNQTFDLSTVICPCRSGTISLAGIAVPGEARTNTTPDGDLSSTAFLAFAESWLGPFANGAAAA